MYITSTTATLVGNVLTGGGTVQERGFYYTEYTYDMKVSDYTPITLQQEVMKGTQVVCTQDSEFSYSLENLEGDTDYYYLAYARTEMGILTVILCCLQQVMEMSFLYFLSLKL